MWKDYEKKPLIKAKGGIRSSSKRGDFSSTWWSKQWIAALESFHDSARLKRGKTYARKGQVLSIEIEKGHVYGQVQGTSRTPYQVEIKVETFSKETWKQIVEALSTKIIYTAKLFANEMPSDIDKIFEKTRHSLLPSSHHELVTDCSCPDWSNPCKHVAAVYYLLGEEFDRDPFLIFKLRGLSRDELFSLLESEKESAPLDDINYFESVPLLAEDFWEQEDVELELGESHTPSVAAALPKGLGQFPFWRGEKPLQEEFEVIYRRGSQRAFQWLEEV